MVWDLCSGIGSFAVGCARAGLRIKSYNASERNTKARGVFRANIPAVCAGYGISREALESFDLSLPQDVLHLEAAAPAILQSMTDSQLPTLVAMTAPCTAGSAAGRGEGPGAAAGQVFLSCLAIVGHIFDEYAARGLSQPGSAPCGWLFETSPLRDADDRPGVRSLDRLYTTAMGQRAVDDAGCKGSTAHRSTQMYTNLGTATDWPSIHKRGVRMPYTPIHQILRPGEYMQVWDVRNHGHPRWPDAAGMPPVLYPKFVRSFGSHAWRAQQLTEDQLRADAAKPNMFSGRSHAIGVSSYKGYPHIPTCSMTEAALGFPAGYTATSLLPDASAFQGYRAAPSTNGDRYGYLGDVWDPNLITAVLQDRLGSSRSPPVTDATPATDLRELPEAPTPAPNDLAPPAAESATPDQRPMGQPPSPPRASPGSPANKEAATSEWAHSSPAEELEEEFASSERPKIIAPHKSDRQEPRLPFPEELPLGSPADEAANAKYRLLLSYLRDRRTGALPPEAKLPDKQFEEFVMQHLINPTENFTPGNLHAHHRYWASFLSDMAPELKKSKQGKEVLQILLKGVPTDWVPIDSPTQTRHPKWALNVAAVRRMLQMYYTEAETEQLLSGDSPGRVQLPNLKSCFTSSTLGGVTVSHEAFVDKEVQANVASKVVVEWWWPNGEPPECILPLGVNRRELTDKLRLTYDGRYTNLFQRYIPFKYESMADMVTYLRQNGWLSVSDFKAGYHHCSLQPELAKYVGFEWKGTVYVYAVLPFGLSSSCRLFSLITGAMFRPLRNLGIDLTVFIDDRCSHNRDRLQARLDTLIQFALMGALGWYVNVDKSVIAPAQLAQFLGMLIDTLQAEFRIPPKKLSLMLKQIDATIALIEGGQAPTSRTLASIAGRTMATTLANPLAPLLCADLFEAMRTNDWDAPLSDPSDILDRLRFLAAQLRSHNGAAFWQRPGGIVFAGDAGEAGAGGFTVTGELRHPIQVSYTPEQQAAIEAHEYHSTAREVDMVHTAVTVLMERSETREALFRRRLKYLTDSQPAFHIIMGKRSPDRAIRERVFQIWAACRANHTTFSLTWVPRSAPPMPEADGHTRMTDNTSWSLAPWAFSQVLADLHIPPEAIQLDPFSQAEFDKSHTGRWFSKFDAPGSSGVDGFLQSWRTPTGESAFCFVNGPFNLMAAIIQKVVYERVDCILIYPQWNKPWRSQLAQLPTAGHTVVAHHRKVSPFIPGSRVEAQLRDLTPYWKTHAILVRWPSPPPPSAEASAANDE